MRRSRCGTRRCTMRQQSAVAPLSAGSASVPLSSLASPSISPAWLYFFPFLFSFLLYSSVFVSFSHSEPMKHAAQWDRPSREGERQIRTILLSFSDVAAGASDFTSLCRDKRLPEEAGRWTDDEKYFEIRKPRYGGTREETREDSARPKQSSCDWNKKQHPLLFYIVVVTVNPGETQHRVKVDDGFNENKSRSRSGVDENTRRNGLGSERTFYATVVTGDVFARPDGWMDGCFAYAGNDALGKQRLGFLFGHVLLLDFLHPTRQILYPARRGEGILRG